jgi:nucleotide-binding universal stress UspA family protein
MTTTTSEAGGIIVGVDSPSSEHGVTWPASGTRLGAHPTLLVGVSTSAASAAAVRWAAVEAARRGARLHAVHVVDIVDRSDAGLGADPRLELADAQQSIPARVAGWLFTAGLEADLVVSVTCGDVAGQLAAESQGASLVVVGASDGTKHGPLAATLAAQCLCLVAVVSANDNARFVEAPDRQHSRGASHVRT